MTLTSQPAYSTSHHPNSPLDNAMGHGFSDSTDPGKRAAFCALNVRPAEARLSKIPAGSEELQPERKPLRGPDTYPGLARQPGE